MVQLQIETTGDEPTTELNAVLNQLDCGDDDIKTTTPMIEDGQITALTATVETTPTAPEVSTDGGIPESEPDAQAESETESIDDDVDDDGEQCTCGETFESLAKRRGHQAHCEEHLATKTNDDSDAEPLKRDCACGETFDSLAEYRGHKAHCDVSDEDSTEVDASASEGGDSAPVVVSDGGTKTVSPPITHKRAWRGGPDGANIYEETLGVVVNAETRVTSHDVNDRIVCAKTSPSSALTFLYQRGFVGRTGSGERGDPYRYSATDRGEEKHQAVQKQGDRLSHTDDV